MNRLHDFYCRSGHWRSTLEQLVSWAIAGVDLGAHVLELGPGQGLVMPLLRSRTTRVTAIDKAPSAIRALGCQPGVGLVRGDATDLPFAAGTFSAVVAFTMLHHIPTKALQQQLFREVFRILQPGGVFVAVDPQFSFGLWLFHLGDTYASIPPDAAAFRLASAGFRNIVVERRPGFFRFCAHSSGAADVERTNPTKEPSGFRF